MVLGTQRRDTLPLTASLHSDCFFFGILKATGSLVLFIPISVDLLPVQTHSHRGATGGTTPSVMGAPPHGQSWVALPPWVALALLWGKKSGYRPAFSPKGVFVGLEGCKLDSVSLPHLSYTKGILICFLKKQLKEAQCCPV